MLSGFMAIGSASTVPAANDVSNTLEKVTISIDPLQSSVFVVVTELNRQLNANLSSNEQIRIKVDLTRLTYSGESRWLPRAQSK
jgi:hypothetical protein